MEWHEDSLQHVCVLCILVCSLVFLFLECVDWLIDLVRTMIRPWITVHIYRVSSLLLLVLQIISLCISSLFFVASWVYYSWFCFVKVWLMSRWSHWMIHWLIGWLIGCDFAIACGEMSKWRVFGFCCRSKLPIWLIRSMGRYQQTYDCGLSVAIICFVVDVVTAADWLIDWLLFGW